MPSVTHDGRSFMIDGRRVWLVSGRIPYARLSRDTWADRIRAAKQLGLNTVETPIFWNRHEVRPGKFDFAGDNDLRHFVDLVGKAGMYCILSVGPYVNADCDLGGIPAWLRDNTPKGLRTNNGPFLESCSRYLTAVADQIKGWQVTAQGTGGPIILLQCESQWTCGHDAIGAGYLGELTRYIREAGLNVPVVNSNNLWQSVEGQIDGWSDGTAMLATMRQLASVRPGQPRVVVDLAFAKTPVWGRDFDDPEAPNVSLRRLAEICAGGGQFNLTSFCAGTNFGFSGGRLADAPDTFACATSALGCLVDEAGRRGDAFASVRRIAHAASRFARVFANLDPSFKPIAADPGDAHQTSIIYSTGAQGGAVFVFAAADDAKAAQRPVTLLLPDGTTIPVPVSPGGVAWCFFDVNITTRCRLDYSNLSALGAVGQALVVFGPQGSAGVISVNGSPVEVAVPDEGDSPAIIEHEGLTLIVLNEAQADETILSDDTVLVGVLGIDPDGTVHALPGAKSYVRVNADGTSKKIKVDAETPRKRTERVVMTPWNIAPLEDYADGTSARFARIQGAADLSALGCPYGYGWYRITFKGDKAHRVHAAFPNAADRLHLFAEGAPVALVGVGPGAEAQATIAVHKGEQSIVVLAENLGRFSEGACLGESKGLFGPAYEVTPIRPGKPEIEVGAPVEILPFRAPLWEISEGDTTSPDRITWRLHHRRKTDVLMTIDAPPPGALLIVNDKTVAYIDRGGPHQILLDHDLVSKGGGVVQLALVSHAQAERECKRLASCVRFDECVETLFAGASFAFAKWELPSAASFGHGKGFKHTAGTPCWWKCTFTAQPADGPLALELAGLTKGQIYINGRHLSRYFVATGSGKKVPPQSVYHVPASWFKGGEPNDLMIFDEHGASPSRVHLSR